MLLFRVESVGRVAGTPGDVWAVSGQVIDRFSELKVRSVREPEYEVVRPVEN